MPAPSEQASFGRKRTRSSILRRLVRQSLLISAFTILFLSTLSFIMARSITTQQRLFDQLSALATSKKEVIENKLQLYRQETFLVGTDSNVAAILEGRNVQLDGILEQLRQKDPDIVGVSVINTSKKALAVAGETTPPLFASPDASILIPNVDRKVGWNATYVYAPVRSSDGETVGYVGAKFSSNRIIESIYTDLASGVGKSATLTLAMQQGGEIFVVTHSRMEEPLRGYVLGVATDPYIVNTPIALAVSGREGVRIAQDDRGQSVLVAHRFLPTLGWGLVLQVDTSEAFSVVSRLALALLLISFFLLCLSGLIGFTFARKLTEPLMELVEKIKHLGPGHWEFQRSVKTSDEVELLDEVIADLSSRLKGTYEHLEEMVAERTQELKKQYAIDHAILDSIQYGVMSVNTDGTIADMNPAAVRLLGMEKEDCLGREAASVLTFHRQRGGLIGLDHPVTRCLSQGTPFRASTSSHVSVLRKDQTYLPVMLMVTPFRDDGKGFGALVVFLDVSEERQTDYMKSEFISLASHQLRTPLSSMRWYLELLTGADMPQLDDTQKSYISEIDTASRRMANLLDTLLRVAQLDDQGMVVEKRDSNGVDIVSRIVEELGTIARAEDIRLHMDVPSTSLPMRTDPVLLSIVIQNLISNAIKYSPRSSDIIITLSEDAASIYINVKDNGMGIPVSEQPRVFEKFFRAKNIRDLLAGGTGLGLYLSKRIVENLGGAINFVSTEGKGTTFTVTLPKQ